MAIIRFLSSVNISRRFLFFGVAGLIELMANITWVRIIPTMRKALPHMTTKVTNVLLQIFQWY